MCLLFSTACVLLLVLALVNAVAAVNSSTVRLNSFLKCLCKGHKEPPGGWITDEAVLERHYQLVLNVTSKFRPVERSNSALYKSYFGPRLEDHWTYHMVGAPGSLFFPVVPIFVNWVEVKYGIVSKFNLFDTLKKYLLPQVLSPLLRESAASKGCLTRAVDHRGRCNPFPIHAPFTFPPWLTPLGEWFRAVHVGP